MTASLINQAFKKCKAEGRPALLTYTVAGDPSKKISLDILKTISKNVDIIESGMAFSTPILPVERFGSCCKAGFNSSSRLVNGDT